MRLFGVMLIMVLLTNLFAADADLRKIREQAAAWFSGSSYFVNMVQGGGLWGFDGIRRTLELMTEAFLEEKAPEDLIIRKGWGCESCI